MESGNVKQLQAQLSALEVDLWMTRMWLDSCSDEQERSRLQSLVEHYNNRITQIEKLLNMA